MSKATELRILREQRSIDAPINYHHRSGDSEGSGGSMLDFYAQEASAEEEYFGRADEEAREVFVKAFRLYLKKTLTGKERKFLKGILAGKETPAAIGKALGVKWFECLQEIQRKAFNNATAFGRVVQLSGWSRAQEFSETVFKRLELLKGGVELNELLPQNRRIEKERERDRRYRETHPEKKREYNRKWREAHPEEIREISRRYYEANLEKERERVRRYRETHSEELRERRRKYYEENSEKAREYSRVWQEANREKKRERDRRYRETHSEELRERRREWRETHSEKVREYRVRHEAKKKAAKALAGLMQASQQEPENNQAYTE